MAQQTLHFGLKINADTSDARAELDRLKQVLGQLGTGTGFKFNAKQEIREASVAAQQLQKHLAAATNKTGDFDINRFTASIKKGEMSLSEMSMKLMQIGTEGTNAFKTLSTQILNAQKPALSFSNILTKMGTTLANNIRWQLSSAAINAVTGSIQEAWHYTKEMDKALTNIRVVTGKSREEMDSLAKSANKMAKELRSTTQEIVKGQLIFYQQGDSAAQAAEKARITTMAANVSFNSSQEEMADYLTAIWNSYQVGSSELELFVDKLAAVGASTATSMEEIATGMQKVAASANAVGVTYDQLNATIATISSTTRTSAEQVGTAMKTIYARMGDLKAGKTDEDGITYGQVSTQIKKLGFDIADANGQLRDMGEVVEEIGSKWHTLSDETQQALAQAIAGKRQYTNLFALFDNWDMYLDTLETSKNAMGTLQEQQDAWADSIEGASNRVTSSFETLYSQVINDEAIIDMTNGLASFLEYFTGLIDALGGLGTILPAIGGLLVSAFAPAIVSGLTSGVMNLRTLFGGWAVDLKKARDGLVEMANAPGFDRLSAEQQKLILNKRDLAIAQNEYVKNSKYMTAQQKQEAQFAIETAQALQATITELETTVQAYKDAALASKNFSTAGGANVQNLNAGSATMAFRKAFDTVNSNQGFFSPALKKQLDDIQTKIQSGVTPSVDELRKAIIAYNNEVNNLNAGGAPANVDQLGKSFDKLMTRMSKVQAKMEGYRTLASSLTPNTNGGGFTFDTKDITVTTQIRQALKDVGVEASKIEQIMKDGVIPDGVLGPDITDIKSLETAAGKAERTLNNLAKRGNKKFGSPVEELKKGAKATRDLTLANEDYVASLEKAKGQAKSFGTGLTTAIGGITSLTFSLSSLKSAGDAIKSGDWLTGISSGLMGLTMAGSGIKSIADGLIKMHGEGGEAIKGLARSMNDMGLTFQKTGSLVTDSAMSATTAWISVLGPILAVAAALAALGAVIYLVAKDMKKAETNAKSAAEQAKTFSTELENANQELTDLKSNFENYNTKQSALDKMTEGTDEFKKALQEANEEVIDLITKYPELAEYVNDVNGRLKITAEGQKKLLEAQQAEVDRAYANKLSSNIVAIESRQEADEQKLAGKVLKDKASATGETVGTALGAAAAGAAIGAFAGPIGAIIGGLVGAAAGVAGGYFGFGADDRNNKEHGLDKFTHAVETQGINIMSSYETLEAALDGDTELAKALWENKEETNKLAKEIVANKKQIDLNTKQLIIANNPEVAGSKYSSDITNIGKDIVQNEGRINKYKEEIKAMFADGDQDAMDAYLKAMYGDEADKYRIVNKGGTGNTLQKQNDDGTWTTQGEKNSLTNDVIIDNYAAKMASNLTDAEVKAIEKTSKELKERIQNYTEGNGDEIVKEIIDEYGGTPEKALKYIEEQGAGYYAIFTKHLSEGIDKAFSGSANRMKSEEEALKFILENNPAFEGLEEAFLEGNDEVLQGYLDDFQALGVLIDYDLETFKAFKDEILDGKVLSGTERLIESYKNQDFIGLGEYDGLRNGTKWEDADNYVGGKNVKLSDSELKERTEALLADSDLTDYQIAQVVSEVIEAGKFTDEIEQKVNAMIGQAKAVAQSSISDVSVDFLNSEDAKSYFNSLENGAFEAEEYRQAVEALNNTEYSRMEITKEGIVLYDKQGTELDTVTRDTMAFNAVLKDGLAPLDAFNDKLGKDTYDALVKYNNEIGRTDEETNKFLDAIDNFDTQVINELSKNLSEGNFESFKLEDGVLTFYDKYGEKVQEVAGKLENLKALAKSIDPNFEVTLDINTKDILAGLKKDKTKIEKEISSWNLDFSKAITLTEEQQMTISNFLPNVDWSEVKTNLANNAYNTINEFIADINNKKFESIAINLDIETTTADPQILYDYADALGVPKEKADELKVAFQELADNGIAYATEDKGVMRYFDATGKEITGLGEDAIGATAQLIALGREGIKPLSSYPGVSNEVYSSILRLGAASAWSKELIDDVLTAISNLSKLNIDLTQPIGELLKLGGTASDSVKKLLIAAGAKIIYKPGTGGIDSLPKIDPKTRKLTNPFTKPVTMGEIEVWYNGQKIDSLDDIPDYSKLFGTSGAGEIVLPTFTNPNGTKDDGITDPGDTTGNGGDSGKEEDPQWKKDYEEAIAQIEHEAEMLGTAAKDIYTKRKKAFETALSEAKKAGQHTEYFDDFQGWSEDLKNSYADILSEEEKDWDYAIKTGQKTFAEIEKDFLELLNGKILDENGKEIDAYTVPEKKELKEEFYSDWNRFFDTIKEGYKDAKYSAKDALSEMWKIANDTSFSEYERNQMRKEIRSYGEELISNLPDDLEKGAITWEKAIENFGDIVTNTWGIVLKNMTREQFLQLPEEQRTAIQDSALGILDAIETAWNNNELDFSEGIKWRDEFLKENASVFSDIDKAIYSNNKNWIGKYLSSQQSLYEKGAISAEKFRNNLLTAAEAFPEHAALITKAYEDTLQVLDSIQKKYSNLIAQQEIIDWGMHTKYNLGNVAEYKLPYAQQQYDELMAYKSWYEAMNPSTDLVNDETYQSIISSIKSAQDALQELANEHIQFSLDWISHEESMNRLTYEDKVAAYDRILKKIESGYYRQMFTNEEDYINWQKKQNANLRQSKIDAAQAEAQQYADILKEKLEDEKTYYENLKSIREKSFDASKTIRESQHELNMELQKSLTMYEYLDEETRKLIFNEEDYVALTKELSNIQTEINDLTSTYENKIASATTEEAELLTAEYEAQVELKLKEFEIAKSNLEIAKKQMALQNTLNERNTRMFINGQWTWVANQEEVAKAREELAEAEFDAETATLEHEHQQAMNQLDNAINDIQREVNEIDEVLKDLEETLNGEKGLIVTFNKLNEAANKAKNDYENQKDLLDSGWSDYNDLPIAEKSFLSKLNKASEEISNGKENVNIEFVQKVWNNKTGQFDYEKHTLSRANAKSKWLLDGEFELTDEAFENYKESAINRKDKELVLNTELNKDNIYEFGGKKYKYDQEKEQWVNIYNPDKEMTIDEQEELIENLMDNGIAVAVDDFEELSVSIDASTNAITSDTATIIDLLTKIMFMDKETRDAYLNTLKNAKEGDEFTLGPKTFIKEDNGWRDINDKSDNPILYSVEDIINGIYYKQNPNAKAEDEAYAAKYDNYKKVHFSTSGVAQADDVWWSSESPDKHGQSDEAKALIDAGIITDQGWFQDSVKQAQYYKKKIAEYLPEDIANKLFSAIDTKYLGEAFAASYYKNLYEGIVAVTKDGRQSEWVDIAAASYNGDFYNDMGWLLKTDSAAAKDELTKLDLTKNKEAIESITKTSEDVTNAAIEYIVVSGDNLSAIAKKYGVTVDEILAANPDIKNPNLINIGQKIKIPGKGTTTTTSDKKTATTTKTNTSNTYSSTEAALWASLKAAGYSDEAAAAIMGNIYHESGIRANNVQDEMGWTDAGYLQAVKNGSHDFINDNIGWGLAQWTDPTRKKALFDYLKKKGMSIDNVQGQIEFLILELAQKGFGPEILNALGFNDASNKILFKYENPLDQSASVQRVRQNTGSKYLNKYGGDKYLSYQTDGSGEKVTSTVTTDGTGKPQTTTFTSPSNNITINQSLVLPEALINTLQFILEEIYKITAIIHGDSDGFLKVHDGTLLYEQEMDLVACTEKIVESIKNIKISAPLSSEETPEFNARGNIINRPTLSWVGEDGPEAIIPLSQKYRDRGLSLWEEATKALGIAPSFTMPTIRASFPQQKENMNVSQTINVTVQNEDSSNDFYAITNLL